MRLAVAGFFASVLVTVLLGLPDQAAGISQENRDLLERHFRGLGEVTYELYAPLGGPEIGGAVIEKDGQSADLLVVRVEENGRLDTLLSRALPVDRSRAPFTFLLSGEHLLVNATCEWVDPAGRAHRRGDLEIHDLVSENGPKLLFELKDVLDLSFQAGGAQSSENLLWQPRLHYLNHGKRLPVKFDYARLVFDSEKGEYRLRQHLTALPDAGIVEASNLNNRAIYYYKLGYLRQATRLLEQAAIVADTNQSIVLHNQALVNNELDDLAAQARLTESRVHDEALLYYWQGEFKACLGVLEGRLGSDASEADLALLGLALAHERRWPEVDNTTLRLQRRGAVFLSDHLYNLVATAEAQGLPQVVEVQLKALEAVGPRHPGCIAAKARLLRQAGQAAEAERILERYLASPLDPGQDPAPARMELYELYRQRGHLAGCERLVRESLAGPMANLWAHVELADYVALTSALVDIAFEETGRIAAPSEPLEGLSLPERQLYPSNPEDSVRPIE